MNLADKLRARGFRKWYERQLLKSHAHLVLTLLSAVGVFAAIEAASRFRAWSDQLLDAGAVLLFAAAGVWSLRKYLEELSRAEAIAEQAVCAACGAYGRLEIGQQEAEDGAVPVRCRGCGHRWHILD